MSASASAHYLGDAAAAPDSVLDLSIVSLQDLRVPLDAPPPVLVDVPLRHGSLGSPALRRHRRETRVDLRLRPRSYVSPEQKKV